MIALGGGVIGDVTGFACSILRRGCRFVQVPTTLLAQVDSSVGGKTAINVPQGKNLIGAFYQPSAVLADLDAFSTLPQREFSAGYAEVVKYGLINDPAFFNWLDQGVLNNGPVSDATALTKAVTTSCQSKAEIVAEDEREQGKRALLNLGHTFGHALEGFYGFSDRLLHGEAVAAGMGLAFEYSVRLGLCPADHAARVKNHLRAHHLPAGLHDMPEKATLKAETLMDLMMQDKKVEQGALTLILARRIGDAFIEKNAAIDDVTTFLKEEIAG